MAQPAVLGVVQVSKRRYGRDDGEERVVDLLEAYGFMVAGAVIVGLAAIPFSLTGLLTLEDWEYDIPGPWLRVAQVTAIAAPVVASVGAAVLVGPSSDLVNFLRAVGGVLVGLATSLFTQAVGIPTAPQIFTIELEDGRILTGAEAAKFQAEIQVDPSTKVRARSFSWQKPSGWQPSQLFVARFVLFVCIVPPIGGAVVAFLIADWN